MRSWIPNSTPEVCPIRIWDFFMKGKPTLVFETSTPCGSLAMIQPGGHFEQREFTGDRSHNAALFSPLKALMGGCESLEVGLVLAGSGPGSYSGTRVGIAAAQGVAIAASCPAVAVPSILAVPSARNGDVCLAIGDARRGSFWTAWLGTTRRPPLPQLTDLGGLEAIITQAASEGIPVFSFEEPGRFPLPPELREQVRLEIPTAEGLWHAWMSASNENRDQWMLETPQPMYLRPPHITPPKRPWLRQVPS